MTDKRGITRRNLILGVAGAAAVVGLGGATVALGAEPLCRPPGGQGEEHFIARCIRCEKCREACPQKLIVPAAIESGLINARTPTLNYKLGWCDFCTGTAAGKPLCVDTCPTQALTIAEQLTPDELILGTAFLVEDWCLAWQLRGCRLCFDVCPYEAIELDKNDRPTVLPERCNGCGLCENVCISMKAAAYTSGAKDRAITVKPVQSVRSLDPTRAPASGQQMRRLA
jgi:ferredoxin-type protein NapG